MLEVSSSAWISLDAGLQLSGSRFRPAAARISAAFAARQSAAVSTGAWDSVGAPYDPEKTTNAQRKQTALSNASEALRMPLDFHITRDYELSYNIPVAEFLFLSYT